MVVFPIQALNYQEGCGFFIDHYFVTAGHVITGSVNPRIRINQEWVYLTNPFFFEDSDKADGLDLAIFDIKESVGDLELYTGVISEGMLLQSHSFKSGGEEYVECEVIVNNYREGNYFGGLSSVNLKAGCSGSPVLFRNQVVGVMHGGNNADNDDPINSELPLNFCAFLSSSSILEVLNVQ